ncbi:LapA family protein [Glaciimonas sp. CA11.2]|uniref:LapA family protein n=1 Tax=unclassified Glaciimonas TaxID=2644401 RepID=UPI002AB5D415|nr:MULTISPECIES: LapA family protein [unclassified Glaciimonas]MDY7546769.1 LapA family protein [Glaciimonas sp. CA11.2]MEB0011871.1 LapA family protein [Glaciimonas sp. Cout2]MEB0080573.1 LapA family protein [Glaciimonas sp. Gout2]MEB0164611.1 LapA family protein [Glaciimonas sp. CA11.2]
MKIISRVIAILLFLVFFGFALKNTQEVTLEFLLNYQIRGPLVLILLGFFGSGAILGVLAMAPAVFRHRRSASKSQKALASMQREREAQRLASAEAPPPDSIRNS